MRIRCAACFKLLQILDGNNKLVSKSVPPEQKSYLATCHHTYCAKCVEEYRSGCIVCKKAYRKMEISSSMPSNLRILFEPLEQSFNRMVQVADVHAKHDQLNTLRLQAYNSKLQEEGAKLAELLHVTEQRWEQSQEQTEKLLVLCNAMHEKRGAMR